MSNDRTRLRRATLLGGAATFVFGVTSASMTGPAAAQDDEQAMEQMVVTGSRIPRADLVANSPVSVVSGQELTLSGTVNVEQLLNTLPQVVPSLTNTSNNPGDGSATIDLRGLGTQRTLVLVNGRRWIPVDTNSANTVTVDINTIPSSLIERVEVVSGGASAVYGSDAIAGVVNFILKDDFEGLELNSTFGITDEGDSETWDINLTAGGNFGDGRGNAVVFVDYYKQEPTFQADRGFSAVTCEDGDADDTCAGVPGLAEGGSTSPPQSRLTGGQALTTFPFFDGGFTPGADDTSNFSFDPDGTIRPFSDPADRFNYAPFNFLQVPLERWEIHGQSNYQVVDQYLDVYLEGTFANTRSDQELAPTPAVLGVGSGSTVDPLVVNVGNPFLQTDSIGGRTASQVLEQTFGIDGPCTAPVTFFQRDIAGFFAEDAFGEGDPFSQFADINDFCANATALERLQLEANIAGLAVATDPGTGLPLEEGSFTGDADGNITLPGALQRRLLEVGPRQSLDTRNAWRVLVGGRGEFDNGWRYDVYYSFARTERVNRLINDASALRFQQALLAVNDPVTGEPVCTDPSGGCAPINPFGAGNISQEAADFIRVSATNVTITQEQVLNATLSGDLMELPAGPLGFAVGAEYRADTFSFAPDSFLAAGDVLGFNAGAPTLGRFDVWELYVETAVPIIAELPGVEYLGIDAGIRYSDYSIPQTGGVWTYKATGEWRPYSDLKIRGGFQRAIRAPNILELFQGAAQDFPGFTDPCDSAVTSQVPEFVQACLNDGLSAADLPTFEQGNAQVQATVGGNPDLQEEEADTITIGAVWQPQQVPGLTVTVDYYSIEVSDAIAPFGGGAAFVIFGCIFSGGQNGNQFCDAYDRGVSGDPLIVSTPNANIATLEARGIDLQLDYSFDLADVGLGDGAGTLDLSWLGAYRMRNTFQANPDVPAIECAGFFGAPCGQTINGVSDPEFRFTSRITYRQDAWSASLRWRWSSSTEDARISQAAAFGLPDPTPTIPEAALEYKAEHYIDLSGTWDVNENFTLVAGINNLFDNDPPIVGTQQVAANTDPSLYDVLGRRFFVSGTLRF